MPDDVNNAWMFPYNYHLFMYNSCYNVTLGSHTGIISEYTDGVCIYIHAHTNND